MKIKFNKKIIFTIVLIFFILCISSCATRIQENVFASVKDEYVILLVEENVSVKIDKVYDKETSVLLYNQLFTQIANSNYELKESGIQNCKKAFLFVTVNQRSFLKGVKYKNSIDFQFKLYDENNQIIFQGMIIGSEKDNILSSNDRYKYSKKLISTIQSIWQK